MIQINTSELRAYNRAMLISRRSLLSGLAASTAAALVAKPRRASALAQSGSGLHVDPQMLRQRLEALSVFGRPAGGSFADGVSRVAYSDADVAGRQYVIGLMKSAGLAPRIDPAGNIFGRRAGSDPSLPPILFGSHIDSVPNGGNFDGDLGSLGALSTMEALARAGQTTRHSLEMVVWAHEEGVAFGRGLACSRIVAGDITPADLDQTWNGMRRADGIRKIGGDPDRILDARKPRGAYHAYVELHIEQGGTLEKAGLQAGIVEGIVAIDRYDAVITGFANHAGTTPMIERHDALLAASHLTIALHDVVTRTPGRQVGTVGHIEVVPNAPNVIPGSAVTHARIPRLVGGQAVENGGGVARRDSKDRSGNPDHDRAEPGQPERGWRGQRRCASEDRTGGFGARAQDDAPAKRRQSRRPDDGAAHADGDDLRAQHRRHQPLTQRVDDAGRTAPTARTSCWERSSNSIMRSR